MASYRAAVMMMIMTCLVPKMMSNIAAANPPLSSPHSSNMTHNCSFVQHGVCLHNAMPILRSFGTVDVGECCGNCTADPACVSWNVNTAMKACFLRGSYRVNSGAQCISGCIRGTCGKVVHRWHSQKSGPSNLYKGYAVL